MLIDFGNSLFLLCEMLSGIKKWAEAYDSVQLKWIRSHTSGGSLTERGNDRADQLAKVLMMMMMMMMMIMMVMVMIIDDNDDGNSADNVKAF